MKNPPRITDNDDGVITVTVGKTEVRVYAYTDDNGRRIKMQRAREYVEGWIDGQGKIISRIDNLMKAIQSGEKWP